MAYIYINSFFNYVIMIMNMIITKLMNNLGHYSINENTLYDIFYNMIDYEYTIDGKEGDEGDEEGEEGEEITIGLLTNEIPPIVYGGVATWIVNFIKMFEGHKNITVIPIYLAYNDPLPEECYDKYPNIRVINNATEIKDKFNGIDVCINNIIFPIRSKWRLWI